MNIALSYLHSSQSYVIIGELMHTDPYTTLSFPIIIPSGNMAKICHKITCKNMGSRKPTGSASSESLSGESDPAQGRNLQGMQKLYLSCPSICVSLDLRRLQVVSNALVTPVVPPSGDAGCADGRCGRTLPQPKASKGTLLAVPTPQLGP